MPHTFDSRGSKPRRDAGFQLVPKDRYVLEIFSYEEGYSKTNHYKVTVDFVVKAPAKYAGSAVRFHNVTFIPAGEPGAGIAIHFLKCIGEPWEETENLDIDPGRWMGKRIWADVDIEEYTDKKNRVRQKNVIRAVDPITEADPEPVDEDGVPF